MASACIEHGAREGVRGGKGTSEHNVLANFRGQPAYAAHEDLCTCASRGVRPLTGAGARMGWQRERGQERGKLRAEDRVEAREAPVMRCCAAKPHSRMERSYSRWKWASLPTPFPGPSAAGIALFARRVF